MWLYVHQNNFAEHPGNINKLTTIAESKNIDWELESACNAEQMFAHRSVGISASMGFRVEQ